jgi:hypothetical protein
MKKYLVALVCLTLCLTFGLIVSTMTSANEFVNGTCAECHSSADQHSRHGDNYPTGDCTICHVSGTYGADSVPASSCVECHLSLCESIQTHDANEGTNCIKCHCDTGVAPGNCGIECPAPPDPCASEEIYGEGSVQVQILRALRDNVLNTTPEGQEIIRLYYQWSPVITMAMKNNAGFKAEMKEMIDGILASTLK